LVFDFHRLRLGPFEGPAIVKPPALPVDTYLVSAQPERTRFQPRIANSRKIIFAFVQGAQTDDCMVEMGGWATYDMVQRYAHLSPEQFTKHASVVDRMLNVTNSAQPAL
jgi:hypothetical protein